MFVSSSIKIGQVLVAYEATIILLRFYRSDHHDLTQYDDYPSLVLSQIWTDLHEIWAVCIHIYEYCVFEISLESEMVGKHSSEELGVRWVFENAWIKILFVRLQSVDMDSDCWKWDWKSRGCKFKDRECECLLKVGGGRISRTSRWILMKIFVDGVYMNRFRRNMVSMRRWKRWCVSGRMKKRMRHGSVLLWIFWVGWIGYQSRVCVHRALIGAYCRFDAWGIYVELRFNGMFCWTVVQKLAEYDHL